MAYSKSTERIKCKTLQSLLAWPGVAYSSKAIKTRILCTICPLPFENMLQGLGLTLFLTLTENYS